MKHYDVSKPGSPEYHLGCNYKELEFKGENRWHVGSVIHFREGVKKAETLLGQYFGRGKEYTLPVYTRKDKWVPMPHGDPPEVDDSEPLKDSGHRVYMQLMGILQWLCCIGVSVGPTSVQH